MSGGTKLGFVDWIAADDGFDVGALIHGESTIAWVSYNLHIENPIRVAKIFDPEFLSELGHDFKPGGEKRWTEEAERIINVSCDEDIANGPVRVLVRFGPDAIVVKTIAEAELMEITIESVIPFSWSLLQTVETLEQTKAESARAAIWREFVSLRKIDPDLFLEQSVEKSILEVELLYHPVGNGSQDEENLDRLHLRSWRECLVEVDSFTLLKALDDESRFVTRDLVLCVSFGFVDPAGVESTGALR